MGPWSSEEISRARSVPFFRVLDYLGAYHKRDATYSPRDASRRSIRVQVGFDGHDFRFILTGEKWVNELLAEDHPSRGGGGAIDFTRHITGLGFVQAVKICLDSIASSSGGGHG